MKYAIRVVVFHFICVIIFATLYYIFKSDYGDENNIKHESFLDYLLLSTTIQASVGISGLYPVSSIGKIIMILQQFIGL